jgi:biotin operon repressor
METGAFSRRGAPLLLDDTHPDAERAAQILVGCPTFELDPSEPYFWPSFADVTLLAVDEGFVVVRGSSGKRARSIITCEAGPGRVLLPPTEDELLVGLAESRVIGITATARTELCAIPAAGQALVQLLELALSQKRDALTNFADARHIERVRRKLLHLAQSYGRVGRDGIRIDFPVSHTLLAEMIGSSRETVTRAVDELQRRGFVARRGHTYRLLMTPERLLEPDRVKRSSFRNM